MTVTNSGGSSGRKPAWLVPAGIASVVAGQRAGSSRYACSRALVSIGLYPAPADDADSGDKLIAVGEAFNFMRQLGNFGVLLVVVGAALIVWHIRQPDPARDIRAQND